MFTKQLSLVLLVSVAFSNAGWFSSLTSKVANAASALCGRSAQVAKSLPARVSTIAQETSARVMPVVNEASLTAKNTALRTVANTKNFVANNKEDLRGITAATGLAIIVGSTAKSLGSKESKGLVDALPAQPEVVSSEVKEVTPAVEQAVFSEDNAWNTASDELSPSVNAPYKSTNMEVVKQKLNSAKDGASSAISYAVEKGSNACSAVAGFFSKMWAKCPQIIHRDRIAKNWNNTKEYLQSTRIGQAVASGYNKCAEGLKALASRGCKLPKCPEHEEEHYIDLSNNNQ